ncbi:MAG: energy-coupling factor transporter transmembrane protein EcfT [Propionibacteriaceae bacterium]|nr:energy-coupling factor transporter transmembrane protein EcfT [Propionibacteriaceae bacterium]
MLTLYYDGHSFLHRMNPVVKFVVFFLVAIGVFFLKSPVVLGVFLLGFLCLYILARVPGVVVWRLSRSIVIIVGIIVVFQWFFSSWQVAVVVGLRILILIAGANLLTLTTSTSKLLAIVERGARPLALFGLHPENIAIAVSLTLRFIPLVLEQSARIREAQSARGVKAPWTFLVPLTIRCLRMADGVGEALEVRSGLGTTLGDGPMRIDSTIATS